jgi:hypothetical protein
MEGEPATNFQAMISGEVYLPTTLPSLTRKRKQTEHAVLLQSERIRRDGLPGD